MNQDALRKGFQDLMQLYASRINQNAEDYANGRAILTLPSATIGLIDGLANTARQIFKSEPIVLRLKSPVIVVGDLHGHLLDLFRVLRRFGLPPSARYLFLGDIVDRGEFSTETIILVLLLKVLYPEHVHVIRGNHEFREISETHGFFDEVSKVYPTAMFDKFLDCFSMMPLAALIDNDVVCAHGGIGPSVRDLEEIASIRRPVLAFRMPAINELLWSDPLRSGTGPYEENPRGHGCLFGKSSLNGFLQNIGRKVLIRGHQCIEEGVRQDFGGKCITVFSASRYCGTKLNSCGVVEVRDGSIATMVFPMMKYLRRENVRFGVNEVQPKVMARVRAKFHFGKTHVPGMRQMNNSAIFEVGQLTPTARPNARPPKKVPSMPIGERLPIF